MKTLADFIAQDCRVLSIGLNPSLNAVRDGYPFSTRQNRFWPALNRSKLIDAPLTPSVAAMEVLVERYRFGFTDVVKRPSRNGSV